MLKKITICLFLFGLTFSGGLRALGASKNEPLAMPIIPSIRAMGNAYTAVSNDEYSVFYNPAGYATIKDSVVTVFSLGIKANIDDPALNLYNAIVSGKNVTSTSNLTTYFSDITVSPGMAGPIYFGRVGDNYGFAFYNNIYAVIDTQPGAIIPSASFYGYGDLGFIGGYGLNIPFIEGLSAGFNLKVILRVKSSIEGTIIYLVDTLEDTSNIPIGKAIGFGGDIGLLYQPVSFLKIGLNFRDFFGTHFSSWESLTSASTSFSKSYIKPRIAFGIALYPLATMSEENNFENLVIALDYTDLLNYSNFLGKIKFGVGINAFKIIRLRGGLDGGFLSGGIGFDLKIFHLDIAYYVDELGAYQGANPVQNLMLNFAFKW